MAIQAIIFDAYGTLFDVYSVGTLAEKFFPGKGDALAALWRDKQIDYTRLRTMSARYKPFWDVTLDALVFSCRKLDIDLDAEASAALMSQYATLAAFPECRPILQALRGMGLKLAILSNGNQMMLETVVSAAGMVPLFDRLLSVEAVRKFKTAPEAYQLGPDAFGFPAGDMLFVSSNCWDVCGATWFGYATYWCNRAGAPMEVLDAIPHAQGRSLNDVLTYVEKMVLQSPSAV